jgi:acetyl esterase/lipase
MARMVIVIILFLLSLLSVFRAPALYLWYAAIFVSELPLVFMAVTAAVVAWALLAGRGGLPAACIGSVAFLLFLSPVIRAYSVGASIDKGLDAALGAPPQGTEQGKVPFSFMGMLTGINSRQSPFVVKTYKAAGGATLTLDYYPSCKPGPCPCLVVVHGGSWSSGDSRQLPGLNHYMANAGYNVASINYRLAPQHVSPAAVEDVFDAFAYLKAHAQELRIDTAKLVMLGRSAGAQIALVAAYSPQLRGLCGIVDMYGPADMVWGYNNPNTPLVMNSCKVMEAYLGGTMGQYPEKYKESSPAEWVSAGIPPTLIIHGAIDPLVAYKHSPRLIEKLQKAGAKYYFLSLPWGTHGCDATLNGPGGQLSTYAIERFMKVVTR